MPSVRHWLMSRKRREQAAFISEKVDYLFRHVRDSSGHEYTLEEVAQGIGKPAAHMAELRRGHVAVPGAEVLGAVRDVFGVDRMY